MVNAAAANLSSERLPTKALAAAGQFRAIALWLNEPLIPQGIYAQVAQDKRPGCIRITVEFDRTPNQKPLTQYICHLMWQLNSPLIEGIYLIARSIGATKPLWEERIRIMTPALRERLNRERGEGSLASAMPPAIAAMRSSVPAIPGFGMHLLPSQQLKTVRAFMLTGSAVAAFVFGCMVEVVMSARQEPSLPFQKNEQVRSQKPAATPRANPQEPQLPAFQADSQTITADRKTMVSPTDDPASPTAQATSISYKIEPERDRPNVVAAALEPVGVLQHEQLANPHEPTVTLLFGGEVDLDDLPYGQLESDGQLFSGLPAYQTADLAMVNLQDPLATAATSLQEELLERQRPDAVNLLKAGGVDLVNLTGKSSLSFGEQGLAETLDTLDRHGIFRVGAGRSEREARRPEVLDIKGQRIAYLSYDGNVEWAAYDDVSGVNAVDLPDIVQDIQAIRDEVDWLVVNFRWTGEPPEKPAYSQTNLARLAIDQGADVVVGQHPHQLQGAEIYKGRPIAYSLGDFVFGQPTEDTSPETAVLQVALRDGQMKVDLIPVKVLNGQPQKAHGAEAQRIFEQIRAASAEFPQPMPSSVVLNPRWGAAGDAPLPSEDGSFTGVEETLTAPPTPPEALPSLEPSEDTVAPEADTPPTDATADEAPPATPTDAEAEYLELEVEPIPEELLKDWGPKESPNTLYEPESVLPDEMQWDKPDADNPTPDRSTPSTPPPAEKPAAPDKPIPLEGELEVIQPSDAIPPYSEPLVGPLSSLPEVAPKMKLRQDAIAPAPPQAGMPESRVLAPLNVLKAAQDPDITTIDVQGTEAPPQPHPDSEN